MKITYKQLAIKILTEEERPLTGEEIWQIAVEKEYDKDIKGNGKTPWRTISAQIYVDIRDNTETIFLKATENPTRFYLRNRKIRESSTDKLSKTKKINKKERELHQLFTSYMSNNKGVYTKTIYHEKSIKRPTGMNKWLHPDMVGVNIPINSWDTSMISFSEKMGKFPMTLYSFELKTEVKLSNIREYYFQAVSNSSWANEGYLVAAEICEDEDFREELKRLTSSFGIGIIHLNIESPADSEVLFQAKYKEELDLSTINKLSRDNSDFRKFIESITETLQSPTKRIYKDDFDKVIEI